MECPPASYYRPPVRLPPPPRAAARWVKEWIPQDLAASGGKCSLFKWVREDMLRNLKETTKEPEPEVLKPEPTTEILFLCSYEGCGKTFVDVGALRKHAHVHGEKQYVCQEPGCGKLPWSEWPSHKYPNWCCCAYKAGCTSTNQGKFLDSSKLKRHNLIHTGERGFVCPHAGCGKAFSLDFNLRAHLKTHSAENYHICPYPDCGKRYTSECKLKTHVKAHHEKTGTLDAVRHTPPSDKPNGTAKTSTPATAYSFADRPYVCPYEGCAKAYIHVYKLNLHLKNQHPDHNPEENSKLGTPAAEHTVNEARDHDAYAEMGGLGPNPKRSKPNPVHKVPPAKVFNAKVPNTIPTNVSGVKNQWPSKAMYEEDSEETEEDRDNIIEDGWRYGDLNGDDEETEDED